MVSPLGDVDRVESEDTASSRVEAFLECVDGKRRSSIRVRRITLAVGAAVAAVVYLTTTGVFPPAAGHLAASAGTLVAGLLER